MSHSKNVIKLRDALISVFESYLSCARGIEDLNEEDDFDDLRDCIDEAIEKYVKQFKDKSANN